MFSPLTKEATILLCHKILPSLSNLNAALSDIRSSLTRRLISFGNVFLAADNIGAAFSPSDKVGIKSNPFKVPTSSPSTNTLPSILTIASKLLNSFNVLFKTTIFLSTNL